VETFIASLKGRYFTSNLNFCKTVRKISHEKVVKKSPAKVVKKPAKKSLQKQRDQAPNSAANLP